MKIAVVGAGGIGGYFGALLARSGQDVTLLARGRNLEQIRARGLEIRAGEQRFVVNLRAEDAPDRIGPSDLVLFTVKTYDVAAALPLLPPLLGPDTAVLALQNGVTAADTVAETVGLAQTLGGVAYLEAALAEPGVVVKAGQMQRIVFGPLTGSPSARHREIASVLQGAGITAELTDAIRVAMWRKFVFICAMAGFTTLTRRSIGDVLAVPLAHDLFARCLTEVVAVARAAGVPLPDTAADETLTFAENLPPAMRSSMQKDLEEGRRLELEALNGTVVRLGQEHGVPVPINAMIVAALEVMLAGR